MTTKANALERAEYLLEMLEESRKSIMSHSYNHAHACILHGKPKQMGLPQFDNLNRICRDVIVAIQKINGEDEAKKLLEDLGLDWELTDDNVFRVFVREHPEVGPISIYPGAIFRPGETIWSRLIDVLSEENARKYSWLRGYLTCGVCSNGCGDMPKEECKECGGKGHVLA